MDIAKLTPPDLSGGYIFVYDNDNVEAGDVTVGPAAGWDHPFVLKYPSELPSDGGAALLDYINRFQAALEAPDWLQRAGGDAYSALIDGPAAVDYFLLVELTKNPDGYRGSTYLHKDKNGPLKMGPAWDYNGNKGGLSQPPPCRRRRCRCRHLNFTNTFHARPLRSSSMQRRLASAAATPSMGGSAGEPPALAFLAAVPSPRRAGDSTSATTQSGAW